MKKFNSITAKFLFCIILCTTLSSCLVTKTNVGAYKDAQGTEYVYAKGKQIHLLWTLIPVGNPNVSTPADGSCRIITKYNVLDVIISGLTGGLVSTYTIKVNAKKK